MSTNTDKSTTTKTSTTTKMSTSASTTPSTRKGTLVLEPSLRLWTLNRCYKCASHLCQCQDRGLDAEFLPRFCFLFFRDFFTNLLSSYLRRIFTKVLFSFLQPTLDSAHELMLSNIKARFENHCSLFSVTK